MRKSNRIGRNALALFSGPALLLPMLLAGITSGTENIGLAEFWISDLVQDWLTFGLLLGALLVLLNLSIDGGWWKWQNVEPLDSDEASKFEGTGLYRQIIIISAAVGSVFFLQHTLLTSNKNVAIPLLCIAVFTWAYMKRTDLPKQSESSLSESMTNRKDSLEDQNSSFISEKSACGNDDACEVPKSNALDTGIFLPNAGGEIETVDSTQSNPKSIDVAKKQQIT